MTLEQRSKARQMLAAGHDIGEVAKTFGVTVRVLIDYGLKRAVR